MAAKLDVVVPETWDDETLKAALNAAKSANASAKRAELSALAKTSIAYAGADALGWFVKVDNRFPEGKGYGAFAESVGLPQVTAEMGKRYLAHARTYALGVKPDSPLDQLLRKSGMMSALAGDIAKLDSIDEAKVDDMIAEKAPTNKALAKIADAREIAYDKPKTGGNGGNGNPPDVDRKAALDSFVKSAGELSQLMNVLTAAELARFDKAVDSFVKARTARRKHDEKAAAADAS